MRAQRLLQINIATMAALGTVLLGMGQRSVTLPMMTIAAAALSVWLTDVTGWFRLSRPLASLGAVVAVVVAIQDLFPLENAVFILVVANLLVYLQPVLLFQQKDARIYWQLCMVSLLQVVVASAFSQGVLFGLLLVVYLLVGLSAFALWYLVREQWRHLESSAAPAEAARTVGRRWPLSSHEAAFSGSSAGTSFGEGAGKDLVARLAMVSLGTLLLTAVVFFSLPRFGHTAWPGALPRLRFLVGYSGQVHLGDLGQVIENPAEILRIEFHNPQSEIPLRVHTDVYLHGTVLTRYSDGRWSRAPRPGERPGGSMRFLGPWLRWQHREFWRPPEEAPLDDELPPDAKEVITQTAIIEPLGQRELFYVRPAIAELGHAEVAMEPSTERLLRPILALRSRFTYSLYTPAFSHGEQAGWAPYRPAPVNADMLPWNRRLAEVDPDLQQVPAQMDIPDLKAELLQMPAVAGPHGLPQLVATANRWIAESAIPPTAIVRRARYLVHRLRGSGEFTYSLEAQERDPSIDPIEDFIANNPSGHCEYFATALAMMLRSQGIPCRLVVGYRCDEWNRLGGFYQVRQLHAHTWVEALIPRAQFPAEVPRNNAIWKEARAGWLRLDATAASRATAIVASDSILAPVVGFFDWIEEFWENYVMEMDRARQYQAIYGPAGRWARDALRNLEDPDWWRWLFAKVTAALDVRRWNVEQWFSWRGGLLGAMVYLAAVLVYFAGRRGLRWWLGRLELRSFAGGRVAAVDVAFYRRLQSLLSSYGLVRPPSHTPREFAQSAAAQIVSRTGDPLLLPLPVQLTDAFYQVRFGHRPLDNRQTEAVEHALGQLERGAWGEGREAGAREEEASEKCKMRNAK